MGNMLEGVLPLGYQPDEDICFLTNGIAATALAAGDVVALDTVIASQDLTSGLFTKVRLVATVGNGNDVVSGTILVALDAIGVGGSGRFGQAGQFPTKVTSTASTAVGTKLVAVTGGTALIASVADVLTGGIKIVGVLMQPITGATTIVKTVELSGRNGFGNSGS